MGGHATIHGASATETRRGGGLKWEPIKQSDGAEHTRPIPGPDNQSSNRNINAAATTYAAATNSCTFTAGENVTEFYVTCTGATAGTDDFVLMVYDATSEAVANAWLAEVGGIATPVQYEKLPYNQRMGPFTGVSYFSRLDFDPTIASTRIVIGGAS